MIKNIYAIISGMYGAELFPAGRGGVKLKIRGAGRGKRTRKSTDPKIMMF